MIVGEEGSGDVVQERARKRARIRGGGEARWSRDTAWTAGLKMRYMGSTMQCYLCYLIATAAAGMAHATVPLTLHMVAVIRHLAAQTRISVQDIRALSRHQVALGAHEPPIVKTTRAHAGTSVPT